VVSFTSCSSELGEPDPAASDLERRGDAPRPVRRRRPWRSAGTPWTAAALEAARRGGEQDVGEVRNLEDGTSRGRQPRVMRTRSLSTSKGKRTPGGAAPAGRSEPGHEEAGPERGRSLWERSRAPARDGTPVGRPRSRGDGREGSANPCRRYDGRTRAPRGAATLRGQPGRRRRPPGRATCTPNP
jgi:hypothetical protein